MIDVREASNCILAPLEGAKEEAGLEGVGVWGTSAGLEAAVLPSKVTGAPIFDSTSLATTSIFKTIKILVLKKKINTLAFLSTCIRGVLLSVLKDVTDRLFKTDNTVTL